MEVQSTNSQLKSGQHFTKNTDNSLKSFDIFNHVSAKEKLGAPDSLNPTPVIQTQQGIEQVTVRENVLLSHQALQQRLITAEAKNEDIPKKLGIEAHRMIKSDDILTVIDLTVGENESLGNDMVIMKFSDGSSRQTQKALFEAADSLGVFKHVTTSSDFADWHLNDWAKNSNDDGKIMKAHSEFNAKQAQYNRELQTVNPTTKQHRLDFVIENVTPNSAALQAAFIAMEPNINLEEENIRPILHFSQDLNKQIFQESSAQEHNQDGSLDMFANATRIHEQTVSLINDLIVPIALSSENFDTLVEYTTTDGDEETDIPI